MGPPLVIELTLAIESPLAMELAVELAVTAVLVPD
jgi:hypothetical protein